MKIRNSIAFVTGAPATFCGSLLFQAFDSVWRNLASPAGSFINGQLLKISAFPILIAIYSFPLCPRGIAAH